MDTFSRPASTFTTPTHDSLINSAPGATRTISTPPSKAVKLSKRINARLQLAAALIEADNEEIQQRSAAQVNAVAKRRPKLASESVIFAPYREPQEINESYIAAGKAGPGLDSEGRPVIDFLGVKLPAEKRQARSNSPEEGIAGGQRQRTSSLSATQERSLTFVRRPSTEWSSRPVSRNGSNLSTSLPMSAAGMPLGYGTVEAEPGAELATLSEWGVEKFLSSEARQRIETGRRSRANSVIERPESALSHSSMGRAHSEIGTEASPLPPGDLTLSKLDLLARIKMYREGQQEATDEPQRETALYPSLEEDRLHGHLKALTQADGTSLGVVSQAKNTVLGGRKSTDLGRALSKSGIMGDSWSEQGDDVDPTWTPSHATYHLSEVVEETAKQGEVPDQTDSSQRALSLHPAGTLYFGGPIDEMDQHVDGMAGVGAFSRSRRSSVASNSQLLSATLPIEDGYQSDVDFPRPRSIFASRPADSIAPERAGTRRKSSPHLAMPSSALSPAQDASPRRLSMLNPAFSPRLQPSPDALLASIDPFFNLANLSPYPALAMSPTRSMDGIEYATKRLSMGVAGRRGSDQQVHLPTHGLSTRQLQELAKQNSFPASFGLQPDFSVLAGLPDEDADLFIGEQEIFRAEMAKEADHVAPIPSEARLPVEALRVDDKEAGINEVRPIEAFVGTNQEPDLSSARWGRKKRKSLLASKIMLRKATLETDDKKDKKVPDEYKDITNEDIDDDYISPPARGPLRPLGIECRLPLQLNLPQPLAGTSLAPRRRLVDEQGLDSDVAAEKARPRVPAGFVLHNRAETVSMKALTVQGANGARPFFFSPKNRTKHDHLISDFLQSQGAQRLIPVSASAPTGIGRRAAMNSTALFRNQLVQHEEEKEGWGWEAGSRIGTELAIVEDDKEEETLPHNQADASKKKLTRKEKKLFKKMQMEKQERKQARRSRRKQRELAKMTNTPLQELKVEELSPDEDLDLSETSSDEESSDVSDSEVSSVSQGEARWIDEERPAGRLYGKSLLDVVDERKKKVSGKARQYGVVRAEDLQGDDTSIAASSNGVAASFRDNPVGFNDTRERMEAMFGPDRIWAREMAKRKEEEAKEAEEAAIRQLAFAELEAEEDARQEAKNSKKAKRKKAKNGEVKAETVMEVSAPMIPPEETMGLEEEVQEQEDEVDQAPVMPPTINLHLPQDTSLTHKPSSMSAVASRWLKSDESGNESSGDDSDAQAEERTLALQRARLARSLSGPGQKGHAEQDSDEEEDDMPLSTLRSKLPRCSTFASHLGDQRAQYDSDEEELPLSQLVANRKKKTQSLGTLDLNFMIGCEASLQRGEDHVRLPNQGSDEEDDAPIGLKLAASASLARPIALGSQQALHGNDEGPDSDDEPLALSHPQAAIITEQANMIKQLQTELVVKQQHPQMGPPMVPFPSQHMSMLLPSPYMAATPAGAYSMRPMSVMPMPPMVPSVSMMQPQDASIAMWAAQVDPADAERAV